MSPADAVPAARPERPPAAPRTGSRGRSGRGSDPDHALRDLVGGGASQLGVDGALRGRDVNRPTEDDLAWAAENVPLVRRNWTPPAAAR